MIDFTGDNLYELERQIPAATQLWVPDTIGVDTIVALQAHDQPVVINLAYPFPGTYSPYCAFASYVDDQGMSHQMIVSGIVEHAIGSPGKDVITGNDGDNCLQGEADLAGAGGADTIDGGLGQDTVLGGAGADVLLGGDGNDQIEGGAGADRIQGGSGSDTCLGGAGADTLDGGGNEGDLLSYAGSSGGVSISLAAQDVATVTGGDAQGDLVQGFRNLIGSDMVDTLIDSDKGSLANGANANAFYGGGGGDRIFLGGGNDTSQGGAGNDQIKGEVGADLLMGGTGADRICGGPGADRLLGGSGADRFIYARLADSGASAGTMDRIEDFNRAEGDRIDFSALSDATVQAGQITWAAVGSDMRVQIDVDGDSKADLALLILGISALTLQDFLL